MDTPLSTAANLSLYQPNRIPWIERDAKPSSPNEWFAWRYPEEVEIYGSPFMELTQHLPQSIDQIIPVTINIDFFAGILGGRKDLGHHVIYYEPEMQFYFLDVADKFYKPTTPEKLQNQYRALMVKCAESMPANVHVLNLFHEFRSDKTAKAITQRAKSVLAAGGSFFSPDSPHQRMKGPELIERVARVFVDQLLTSEPGQILKLHDAYTSFLALLKEKSLPNIKRSDFKAVVGPLIRDQFDVALRNDLDSGDNKGVRGWKNVRLVQAVPG